MFIVIMNVVIKLISSACYFACWYFYPDTAEEKKEKVEVGIM